MSHTLSNQSTQPSRPPSQLSSALLGKGEAGSLAEFLRDFDEVQSGLAAALLPLVGKAQVEYIVRMLEYTCVGGKLIRGMSVVEIARILTSTRGEVNGEALSRAHRLGWCTELLQAYFLVIDDILDGSALRRGKPCWHRVDGVGTINAINDGILLKSLVFTALNRWFGSSPDFTRLVALFHECALMTELGQMVDTSGQGSQSLPQFNMEYFLRIARNKTSYYTHILPLECGILAADRWDSLGVEPVSLREVCLLMGEFYQSQNDMLDFANDASVTGKEGTDIQEGKCTWLIVTALERASVAQQTLLRESYGKRDPACVAAVSRIYQEMGITALYFAYEAGMRRRVDAFITQVRSRSPETATALQLLWDKTLQAGVSLESGAGGGKRLIRPPQELESSAPVRESVLQA